MNRIILLACLLLLACGVQAQHRKQLASFTQYRHFYNPSLTGAEGSVVRSLYRNQWTGFKDAPKTIMVSAEIDLRRIGSRNDSYFQGQGNRGLSGTASAKHALGFTAFHDQFGPSKETQLSLSYGAGIRLSEAVSLRWGTALTYTLHRLDGNSLTVDRKDDPRYSNLLGQENRSGRGDINLGLTLAAQNYYLGYAMRDATEGKVLATGSDYLYDFYSRKHVVQAGYRASITQQLGFTLNGLYQYDEQLASTVEGQVKVVYNDMFWLGGGYRYDLAYHVTAGLRVGQLAIGYAYETPTQGAQAIDKATNEITLSYHLLPFLQNRGQRKQQVTW